MIDERNEEIYASNCVNILTIGGYLTSDVKLTYCGSKGKGVYKASFHLKNPNKSGDKVYFNELYVVIHGKRAKDCNRVLSKGDYCTVTGKMCMWLEDNDTGVYGITVNASEVFWKGQ